MTSIIRNATHIIVNHYHYHYNSNPEDKTLFKRKDSASNDNSSDVNIREIDLFSGVPALIAIIVGFLQFLPDPIKRRRRHFAHFIRWLQTTVEKEFSISLYSCEGKCHTVTFRLTSSSIEGRALTDVGEEDPVECQGQHLTVNDLIQLIESGNGETLVHLARITRYPHMHEFERSVRMLMFLPSSARRIIAWQWLHVAILYSLYTIFYGHIAMFFKRIAWSAGWVVLLLLPVKKSNDGDVDGDNSDPEKYSMAVLAQHKLLFEQLPWVRFGVYSLCLDMANKKATFHLSNRDEDFGNQIYRGNMFCSDTSRANAHRERRVLNMIYTDHCSSAQAMYAVGMHCIRVALMTSAIGPIPLHAINGTWGKLKAIQGESYSVIQQVPLESCFLSLYGPMLTTVSPKRTATEASDIYGGHAFTERRPTSKWFNPRTRVNQSNNLHAREANIRYSALLRVLDSPLGEMITLSREYTAILNLSLVDLSRKFDGQSQTSGIGEIFDIPVPLHIHKKLCESQDRLIWRIEASLNDYMSWDIHWGVGIWVLRTMYQIQKLIPYTSENKLRHLSSQGKTAVLCISGYQNRYPLWQHKVNRAISKREDGSLKWSWLAEKLFTIESITPKALYVSNPEWCTCNRSCDGICTLVANTFDLFIPEGYYLKIPYLLASEDRSRTLVCTRDVSYINNIFKKYTRTSSNNGTGIGGIPETIKVDDLQRYGYNVFRYKGSKAISHCYYNLVSDNKMHPLVICDRKLYDMDLVPLNPYTDLISILDSDDPIIFLETEDILGSRFNSAYLIENSDDRTLDFLRSQMGLGNNSRLY